MSAVLTPCQMKKRTYNRIKKCIESEGRIILCPSSDTARFVVRARLRRPSSVAVIKIFFRQLSTSPSRPSCRVVGCKLGLYFIFVPASGENDGRRVGEGATDESRRHRQARMK